MLAIYNKSKYYLNQAEQIKFDYNVQIENATIILKSADLYLIFGIITKDKWKYYLDLSYQDAKRYNNSLTLGFVEFNKAKYNIFNLIYSEAEKYTNYAVSYFKKLNSEDDFADALIHLATIHLELGKLKEAEKELQEVTQIYNRIHCRYLKPSLSLAQSMYARITNDNDALNILRNALKTSRKIGTKEITWQIQREFGLYYKETGNINIALNYYKDAINTIKEITETIEDESYKASYLAVPIRKRVFDEIKAIK